MNNTFQILINWDKGQAFSERMAAKILAVEEYRDIDPQCPVGGPDGTKDILCSKDGKNYVVGCYFPNGQKSDSDIDSKFDDDYAGVAKHLAHGFVFVTNQKINPKQRIELCTSHPNSKIYHGERVCNILDSPKGYGIRLEYLGIELSKEEQLSYLNSHLDLQEQFENIKDTLDSLKKATSAVAGFIRERDTVLSENLSTPPIAGLPMSSRISVEDLLAIHLACLYEAQEDALELQRGFRKVDVWVGVPGCKPHDADFTPPAPSEVPELIITLLDWWRRKYMEVLFSPDDVKISAIAEFHEKFLSIHPFLDGNGRVARILASIQIRDLINDRVDLGPIDDPSNYYRALQQAQKGDRQALVDIFMTLAR